MDEVMSCAHCGGQMSVAPDLYGQTVTCPHCKKEVVIPIAAKGPPAEGQISRQVMPHVPNYLVHAILVMIFCCQPFGVVAIVYAAQVDGKEVLTIEGMQKGPELHPIQEAFVEYSAVQCGYCSPGIIMAAKALLDRDQDPSEDDVRKAISNNLCRCTGYDKPVRAILEAAKSLQLHK